jgi:thiol-disulfide isomerase/thioredoxin
MRRRFFPLGCSLLLCFVHDAAAEVSVGSTRDEVIAQWGDPKSTMKARGKEVLDYPNGRITLADAKVVSIDLKTARPASAPAPAPVKPPPPPRAAAPSPAAARSAAREMWTTDFAAAQAEATAHNRRLLVLFTGSDWCPPCMQFESSVAHAPDFLNLTQTSFVLVKLDYPRKTPQSPEIRARNEALLKRYGVNAFPSMLIIDADGQKSVRVDSTRTRQAASIVDYWVQAVDEARREKGKSSSWF